VQSTGILIENYRQVDFKGAAHRNVCRKHASTNFKSCIAAKHYYHRKNPIPNNPISYFGALHLQTQYFPLMLSILRHAVACLSVSIGYFLKVQRTGMFVENMPALILEAASQRNIIIRSKPQFPTIQFHISVRCTSKLNTSH
jgi:hypothetical protein